MPDNIRYVVLNFIRRRTVWVEFGAVQGLLAVDWCFWGLLAPLTCTFLLNFDIMLRCTFKPDRVLPALLPWLQCWWWSLVVVILAVLVAVRVTTTALVFWIVRLMGTFAKMNIVFWLRQTRGNLPNGVFVSQVQKLESRNSMFRNLPSLRTCVFHSWMEGAVFHFFKPLWEFIPNIHGWNWRSNLPHKFPQCQLLISRLFSISYPQGSFEQIWRSTLQTYVLFCLEPMSVLFFCNVKILSWAVTNEVTRSHGLWTGDAIVLGERFYVVAALVLRSHWTRTPPQLFHVANTYRKPNWSNASNRICLVKMRAIEGYFSGRSTRVKSHWESVRFGAGHLPLRNSKGIVLRPFCLCLSKYDCSIFLCALCMFVQ